MLNVLFIFIGIVAYFLIGGFAVAKLFGEFPKYSHQDENQTIYVIGIIFWPVSVVIGAAQKGIELASKKHN